MPTNNSIKYHRKNNNTVHSKSSPHIHNSDIKLNPKKSRNEKKHTIISRRFHSKISIITKNLITPGTTTDKNNKYSSQYSTKYTTSQ